MRYLNKIVIVISILFTLLFSQADTQKVGIYLNVHELKTNTPSIYIDKKEVNSKKNWRLLVYSKKNTIWYYDHYSREYLKCKEKDVLGFFDGKKFYINYHKNFYILQVMPKYSMFVNNNIDTPQKYRSIEDSVIEKDPNEETQLCILNMNTGAIDVLTAIVLEDILNDDPDLKYDFILNKDRKDLLGAYLSQFNTRN